MRNVFEYYTEDDHLEHHGIKGQKWGVRRFQNPDGTWTDAGKDRYGEPGSGGAQGRAKSGMSEATKKKLKTAAVVTLAVAGTAAVAYVASKKLDTIAVNSLRQRDIASGERWMDAMRRDWAEGREHDIRASIYSRNGDNKLANLATADSNRAYERGGVSFDTAREYFRKADAGVYSRREKLSELKRLARNRR